MNMPFDDNAMTIILGLGDPMEPGMHGPMETPMPDKSAIDLITEIRDMCDKWLMKCGKCKDNCKQTIDTDDNDKENNDAEQ